ncbi:hypothetical protein L2E82_49028 [Cichorium intybus]|uniref:Uncharacterized protein n=1 Tax=Cichorium intybus TaxID=13427 RepID=A0ACB8Z0T0_CICIN|nr:hypothetical protein L2E82_49028 [Cichorium intybus]
MHTTNLPLSAVREEGSDSTTTPVTTSAPTDLQHHLPLSQPIFLSLKYYIGTTNRHHQLDIGPSSIPLTAIALLAPPLSYGGLRELHRSLPSTPPILRSSLPSTPPSPIGDAFWIG